MKANVTTYSVLFPLLFEVTGVSMYDFTFRLFTRQVYRKNAYSIPSRTFRLIEVLSRITFDILYDTFDTEMDVGIDDTVIAIVNDPPFEMYASNIRVLRKHALPHTALYKYSSHRSMYDVFR